MRKALQCLVLGALLAVSSTSATAQTSDTEAVIDLRRETMLALWERLDRLSAFVTRAGTENSTSDDAIVLEREGRDPRELYALVHGVEAIRDARDISELLNHVRELWPFHTNRGWYGETNAESVIWMIPDTFQRYFQNAKTAAAELVAALDDDDIETTQRSICTLSKACGTCHAVFRRVAHRDLMLEGRGWTGNYAVCRNIVRR